MQLLWAKLSIDSIIILFWNEIDITTEGQEKKKWKTNISLIYRLLNGNSPDMCWLYVLGGRTLIWQSTEKFPYITYFIDDNKRNETNFHSPLTIDHWIVIALWYFVCNIIIMIALCAGHWMCPQNRNHTQTIACMPTMIKLNRTISFDCWWFFKLRSA